MTDPERITVCVGNDEPGWCRTTLRLGEIEPRTQLSAGRFHVIEAHVDVVLRVIAILSGNVGPSTGDVGQSDLADPGVQIFDSSAIAAHVEDVEVVEMCLVAAIVALPRPELGIRLAFENVAGLNESFTQPELVVADAPREVG